MSREISSVAVIGLGYIGLPTAAVLADAGLTVRGVDVSPRTVEAVNRGEVPFVEPGLREVLERSVTAGRLSASSETPAADAYIVAVPTPFTDTHSADLSYIEAAADGIAPMLTGGELVILESTSPPGTTEHMAQRILASRPDLNADAAGEGALLVAHCPERVLPGKIMDELVTNDRIVGGLTPHAAEAAKKLYSAFSTGEFMLTDTRTAEMAKLTENSFRDVNIAFANELSVISDKLGINVWELIELANHHPRVNILQPGPGVGGHCIAVDPWFIIDAVPEQATLIRAARETNDAKPAWVLSRIEDAIAERGPGATVALLGLAFKANIDDLRESPSLQIAESLALRAPEARLLAVEPHIDELPKSLAAAPHVTLAEPEEAIAAADVIVLLVDHDVFKAIPAERLGDATLIDSRGIWR